MKRADGIGCTKITELRRGDRVEAEGGEGIAVLSIDRHEAGEPVQVVRLKAGDSTLEVTDSHRIAVERRGKNQTLRAKDLEIGDIVRCSRGINKHLDEISKTKVPIEVVEVKFRPDKAVEVFNMDVYYKAMSHVTTILSKGASYPIRRRRGGKAKEASFGETESDLPLSDCV